MKTRKLSKLGARSVQRHVYLCEGATHAHGHKLYAFGYETLAEIFDTSLEGIKKRVQRGRLDPQDLKSLFEAYREFVERRDGRNLPE